MCGGEGEGGWRVRRGGARYGSFADGRRTSPFSNSRGSLEGPLMLFLLLPFLFLPFFFSFSFGSSIITPYRSRLIYSRLLYAKAIARKEES